jgi:hypothetical protein
MEPCRDGSLLAAAVRMSRTSRDFVTYGYHWAVSVNIRVSFEAGVPVVRLDGGFDGAGASVFDARMSALDTDAVHWVIDVSGVSPATLGFVTLAHTQDTHPGVYAAGVTVDPLATATTIDPEKRLEALPGQLGLPSGRRVVGGELNLRNVLVDARDNLSISPRRGPEMPALISPAWKRSSSSR